MKRLPAAGASNPVCGVRPEIEDGYRPSAVLNSITVHAELEKHLADAEIIITTPFHPAYLTRERLERAGKLQLALTAGSP